MAATDTLLRPEECVMLLVHSQAGLGFGVESASRQVLLNNAVALARTAVAFERAGRRLHVCITRVQRSVTPGAGGRPSFRQGD